MNHHVPLLIAGIEPASSQVFQRSDAGGLDADVRPLADGADLAITVSTLGGGEVLPWTEIGSGARVRLPTGGPYLLRWHCRDGSTSAPLQDLFVGDLWVLAGQSNMAGAGRVADATLPHEHVRMLDATYQWRRAEEPMHGGSDSPDALLDVEPGAWRATTEEREQMRTGWDARGAGPGLAFAHALLGYAPAVPIGLIPVAVGGSNINDWGATGVAGHAFELLRLRTAAAGGQVSGVLWYQGESEAATGCLDDLTEKLPPLFQSLRDELGSDLPIFQVQVGRDGAPPDRAGGHELDRGARAPAARHRVRCHRDDDGDRPGPGGLHPRLVCRLDSAGSSARAAG